MNVSRREMLGLLGAGAVATVFSDCQCGNKKNAKIALQLYSIRDYIARIGLDRTLENLATIGFKAVEFAGYYQYENDPKGLRKALANAGLKACGAHAGGDKYCCFDTRTWIYDTDALKRQCEFHLAYGNNLLMYPGRRNLPGKDQPLDDFLKRFVEFNNRTAADVAKCGCRIGLHNHMGEFQLKMNDGTTYWDYFFSNTDPSICMEQDVGWTTCAGYDPCEQYVKYPHRSPTLHAKENGMGKNVKHFDAILGQPGRPDATPVDWNRLLVATEKDRVEWYVVECERHADDLSAVLPSYNFLKAKGLQ